MSTANFTVLETEAGERLDKFLAMKTGLSRSFIQTLIENPARKVKLGEEVTLEIPESKPLDLEPWDFELNVIYEDDNLVVINKPAGLTVHPAPGNYDNTLVHALLAHCKGKLSGINGVERPGIVHRLDKETSGLIVVAKNDATHKELSRQIEAREIKRQYLAVVCGVPNPTSGVLKTGYGRSPQNRKKMTTFDLTETIWSTGGSSRRADYNKMGEIAVGHNTEFGLEKGEGKRSKIAITEYKVVKVLGEGKASIVECKLQTGRTHQIRVHMKHIGHPIIGDQVYGSRRMERNLPEFSRQALHAYRLEIPGYGQFEAPLADDIQQLLEQFI